MPQIIEEPIHHRILIKASREVVYELLTTAEGWDSFFTVGTELELVPGGTMILRWVDWGPDKLTVQARCDIIRFAPPEQFVFQWFPVDETHPTTVEFNLYKSGDDTILDLKEYGYPDSSEGRKRMLDCATGWGEATALMKFFLEHKVRY